MPAGYDSHYRRYDRIYKAFHDAGVPLAGLREGTKQLFHKSASQSVLRDLHQLEAAMDAGLNVGAITHQESLPGINPLGFWEPHPSPEKCVLRLYSGCNGARWLHRETKPPTHRILRPTLVLQ